MNLQLDLSYLNEISDGDTDFVLSILSTFMEEGPKDLQGIRQALDANDLVECIRKCTVLSSQLNHEVQNAERTVQTGDVVPIDQMENDS